MKLKQVLSKAVQEISVTGTPHMTYPQSVVQNAIDWAADATEITKFEGGQFALLKKDSHYFIKKNDKLVGWLKLGSTTVGAHKYYTFDSVYILPEYRRTRALVLLLYGVKELLNTPIIVDGPLFADGEDLLNTAARRGRFRFSIVDKKTGEKTPYDASKLTADDSLNYVVIESTHLAFFIEGTVPGDPSYRVYTTLLEHIHDIEL